jgi:hypothetical protein
MGNLDIRAAGPLLTPVAGVQPRAQRLPISNFIAREFRAVKVAYPTRGLIRATLSPRHRIHALFIHHVPVNARCDLGHRPIV